jgi:predicted kinase
MKPLHLSMPHLIVMVGIPGSGKSYFADHFASTFKTPIVSSIALRSTVVKTPTFTPAEQAAVRRLSLYMLDELLKTGQTFVYDSLSDARTDRQDVVRLAKNAGYDVLFVWVQTDSNTSQYRATRQTKDHAYALTDEQFDTLTKHFTVPAGIEKPVVISGKHTYASQLKIVLSRLIVSSPTPAQATPQPEVRNRRVLIR